MSIYYSVDRKTWYPARQYQKDAYNAAIQLLEGKNNISADKIEIQNNGVKYNIQKVASGESTCTIKLKQINDLQMVSYLSKNPIIKMHAYKDILAEHNGCKIKIPIGVNYYVYADRKDKPIIGWHGTYNPPLDMNGDSLIDLFI